jgi:hypothetical protein
LIPASCSTSPSREISLTRCWQILARYRIRSRTALTSGGGMKLPASSPHSSSCASHSAPARSVLRPGTFFTCAALQTSTRSNPPCPASAWQAGIEYTPVASIATCVTPSDASHLAISRSTP